MKKQNTTETILKLKRNYDKKINLGLATMISALVLGTSGILTFGVTSIVESNRATNYLKENNVKDEVYQSLDKSSKKNLGLMFGMAALTVTALFGGYYFFCAADKDRKHVTKLETENNQEAE